MTSKKGAATAATREEVDSAIAALTDVELVRLQRFAIARIARIGAAADGRDYQELLSESYRRILGSRVWNKDVALVDHLFGTIRSVSSHWAQEFARELDAGRNLISSDRDTRTDRATAETAPSGVPDAERMVIARDLLFHVRELFAQDELAREIIAGWEEELDGPAIREILGIEQTVFDSKVRAIRRRLIDEGLKAASKKGNKS
ncbi:MAG: hypothetical protein JOZ54_21655 [Acidobacteria bacterium]|nr:hypothetical protein [Acidobacteriota bacterium]